LHAVAEDEPPSDDLLRVVDAHTVE
jgi:hypothetical protein